MTITNEIVLDGTPLGAVGVWYTPFGLAESSFIEDAKVRYLDDGTGEVKFIIRGEAYIYHVSGEDARDTYVDLNGGYSPGGIMNEVKEMARNYRSRPVAPKVSIVTLYGDAKTVAFVTEHALALGLEIK
jgi:hypothetical protein